MALSDPPASLTPTERAAWTEAAARLRHGVKTLQHAALLEAYAIERARWLAAEEYLREHGPTVQLRDDKGVLKAVTTAPELAIARTSQRLALSLLQKLRAR